MEKHLTKDSSEIPDQPNNVNAKIMWDTLDYSLKEYWFTFKGIYTLQEIEKQRPLLPKEKQVMMDHIYTWEHVKETHHWYRVPRLMMKLMMTVYLEDTAYRELMNMYLFELQGRMNKQWNPEVQHKFPLYTCMYDMHLPYFIEWMGLKGGGQVTINVDSKGGYKLDELSEKANILFMMDEMKKRGGGKIEITVEGEKHEGHNNQEGSKSEGSAEGCMEESKSCEAKPEGAQGSDNGKESGTAAETGKLS
jgi:hypothetical protein